MHDTGPDHKIFLLSPASLQGVRARQMLRAAREGEEMEYSTLDVPRHRRRA